MATKADLTRAAIAEIDLLADDGALGREVVAESEPRFTKDQYLEFMRGLAQVELYQG